VVRVHLDDCEPCEPLPVELTELTQLSWVPSGSAGHAFFPTITAFAELDVFNSNFILYLSALSRMMISQGVG